MHSSSILLDVVEWMLILALFPIGAFAGRAESNSAKRRRYSFYAAVALTAMCVCKLLDAREPWHFIWAILAFVCLGRTVWCVEGRRLRRHFRGRPFFISASAQN